MCKKCEEVMGLEQYVDLSDPEEHTKYKKQVKILRKFGISMGHIQRWHKRQLEGTDDYWDIINWDGLGQPPGTINFKKKDGSKE